MDRKPFPGAGDAPAAPPSALVHTSSLVHSKPSTRGLYAVRVHHLRDMKAKGQRISAITCYDATFARLVDGAGIEVVLVGDSLGNVIQGQETTLPVTVDHIVYHSAAVARGLQRSHLVADLPFMSYRNADVALQNAVKLEGGAEVAPTVRALVQAGIPVMGHIGLTPQSVHAMGGHRVQGRGRAARQRLLDDALALQEAGCYAIVLELVPSTLAEEVSQALQIPTIGIGAGAGCDGQILVLYDLLGMNPGFKPKFLKQYAQLHEVIGEALGAYRSEVQAGAFPGPEHGYVDPTLALEPREAHG
jgi:3-methyl-2-oxobutanoate hydroxymethyltransferase